MSEKTAAGRAGVEVRDRLAIEYAEARRAAMSDDERAAEEAEVTALRARIFGGPVMSETAAQAWKRIYGTTYDVTKSACVHFTAGWNAAKGLS